MKTNFLLFAFFALLVSCHRDADIITGGEVLDPAVVRVTTRLVTQTDTTNPSALQGMQTFAAATSAYASSPYIATRGEQVNRDFELIEFTSEDARQFYQVHTLVPNDVNYLHWMIPALQSFEGNTASAAQFVIHSDYSVHIPATSLQYADGTAYEGDYIIHYAFLDPQSPSADAIPSFMAIDAEKTRHALQINSCFYITALTASGDQLHFASTASIEFNTTTADDPWFFDTVLAAWAPDTTSSGNTHLRLGKATYYATATPQTPVRVTGSLYINDRTTPHHRIRVTYGGITRNIFSTNKGAWAIYLPAGEEVTIEVSLPCGNVHVASFTSPEQASFDFPIVINDDEIINSVFSGTLRNNRGEALPEGILVIDGTGPGFLYSAEAAFHFHIPMCNASAIGVQGLDIATGQSGSAIQWQAADSVQLYSVFACEESKMEYLLLDVAGESKMYWDLKSRVSPQTRLIIEEGAMESELDLELAISGMTDREYQDEELNIRFEDRQLGPPGYSLYCPTSSTGCGFSKFVITHFPQAQGEWIRGYFEGSFWMKSFTPLNAGYRAVRGEFQVYRDF